MGSPQSLFQTVFAKCRGHGDLSVVLCGSAFVMTVSAPDSGNDVEEHKKLVEEITNILHESRRAGRKRFHIER